MRTRIVILAAGLALLSATTVAYAQKGTPAPSPAGPGAPQGGAGQNEVRAPSVPPSTGGAIERTQDAARGSDTNRQPDAGVNANANAQANPGTPQGDVNVGGNVSAGTQMGNRPAGDAQAGGNANARDRARYRWHNGHWWYWGTNNTWLFWNGSEWMPYSETAYNDWWSTRPTPDYYGNGYDNGYYDNGYYRRPYTSGYRGYYGPGYYGPNREGWDGRRGNAGAGVGAAIGGTVGGNEGANVGGAIGGAIGGGRGDSGRGEGGGGGGGGGGRGGRRR